MQSITISVTKIIRLKALDNNDALMRSKRDRIEEAVRFQPFLNRSVYDTTILNYCINDTMNIYIIASKENK